MKKILLPVSIAAISAVAFMGCEWGGVHSGESWNDAYSWANFTGTYKLGAAISGESSESGVSVSKTFTGNGTYSTGKANLIPSSVNVTVGSISFSGFSEESNTVTRDNNSVTVNAAAGSVSITMVNDGALANEGAKVTISASYKVGAAGNSNGTTVDSPITWINVSQKGNLLTLTDNRGVTYSGKLTGASCPKADQSGYVTPAHIRFTFEATSTSNGREKISGALSGDWSGGSSATSGTLANRAMDASYSNGKSTVQFMAISGTVQLYATAVGEVN